MERRHQIEKWIDIKTTKSTTAALALTGWLPNEGGVLKIGASRPESS
jgi:hypothetical protein